jgi:hypothetical protein
MSVAAIEPEAGSDHDERGLGVSRLARLVRRAVADLALDLSGSVVLTEAATGAYVVSPVLAALAGATHVHALTADTAYGTVAEVIDATEALAAELGVGDRITVTAERRPDLFAMADIVTNSGHVRPIDASIASVMRPGSALSLMFEAWEIQAGRVDLDLDALRSRGVLIAGTNERHPDIDVFGYLGLMAATQLADAGVAAYRGDIVLLCDNPFVDFIERGLVAAGARLRAGRTVEELVDPALPPPDALVVALTPDGQSVLSPAQLALVAEAWPAVVITQFWGDIDRAAAASVNLSVFPHCAPAAGHMGVLPSRLGPDPVVRLQAGGLKVGQVLRIPAGRRRASDMEYLDVL